MLAKFAELHKFKILNTCFRKRLNRRWIWICPNGVIKKEIDYIMTYRPDICLNVSAIKSFSTRSDHRIIRGKVRINTKLERAKWSPSRKKVDTGKLQHHRIEYQVQIQNRFITSATIPKDDIDSIGVTQMRRRFIKLPFQ